jgi:hypothetical protein
MQTCIVALLLTLSAIIILLYLVILKGSNKIEEKFNLADYPQSVAQRLQESMILMKEQNPLLSASVSISPSAVCNLNMDDSSLITVGSSNSIPPNSKISSLTERAYGPAASGLDSKKDGVYPAFKFTPLSSSSQNKDYPFDTYDKSPFPSYIASLNPENTYLPVRMSDYPNQVSIPDVIEQGGYSAYFDPTLAASSNGFVPIREIDSMKDMRYFEESNDDDWVRQQRQRDHDWYYGTFDPTVFDKNTI